MTWPAVPALGTVTERLPLIFPEGVENRQYCIRESTAQRGLGNNCTGRPLHGCQPTVDQQACSGNEGRFIRGQPKYGPGDFLRLGPAA